jgi:2',3'-cyclic-nucleotide 2'-phosphodiesterase (5'-nucleotidase family)
MPSVSSITSSTFLTRLRIVSINDVYELANLPRLQTYLTKLSPKPSAVVLAGDFLSPSTLSSIDGGRGMVATLRAVGMTHVSLGNHEQDLRLDSLRQRLEDLSRTTTSSSTSTSGSGSGSGSTTNTNTTTKKSNSKSKSNRTTTTTTMTATTVVLNSNMQKDLPPKAEWMRSVTKPYSLVESPCGNVKVRMYERCVCVQYLLSLVFCHC